MAGKMKDIRIQYGLANQDDPERDEARLVFADPEIVEKPRSGMLIDI